MALRFAVDGGTLSQRNVPSRELAENWWRAHEADGIFGDDADRFTTTEVEEALQMESVVEALTVNPEYLGKLLEYLAATSPARARLSYIGTWHLENAYETLGEEALRILEKTNLPSTIKAQILKGFVR